MKAVHSVGLPVLWANVEPDEYVGDGLEQEEGHHGEHGQEGEKVPAHSGVKPNKAQIGRF